MNIEVGPQLLFQMIGEMQVELTLLRARCAKAENRVQELEKPKDNVVPLNPQEAG